MGRAVEYAESLSTGTTSSATAQDHASLSFTPSANTDYWVFWSARFQRDSATGLGEVRFNTPDGDVNTTVREPKDTTTWFAAFGFDQYQEGGSPASRTFKTQYLVNSGSGDVTIDDSRVTAVEADASDEYAESLTESTTTSGTYQDKTTLTFTPSTTGDYLVIAMAEIAKDDSNSSTNVKLDYNSTAYGETTKEPEDADDYMSWGTMVRLNLTNSSKTFKIQYHANGTNTAAIRNARILAIRLDTMDNEYYAETRSRSTTTSTSLQDRVTLTQTPVAKEHVIFMTSVMDSDSLNDDYNHRFLEGATTILDTNEEPNDTSDEHPQFVVYSSTLAASSTTWKTQYSTAGSTAGIAESAIAIIQTEDAGGSVTFEATVDATATLTAALSKDIPFEGGVTAISGVTAALTADRGFIASIATTGDIAATLTRKKALEAALSTTGDIAAAMDRKIGFIGAITGTSTLSGTLSKTVPFVAAIDAPSTIAAGLTRNRGLVAAINTTGDISADITTNKQLEATIGTTGGISADLTADRGLAAVLTTTGDVAAGLSVDIALVAAVTGISTVTGALSKTIPVAAALVTTGDMVADLVTKRGLIAALSSASTVTLAMNVDRGLVSSVTALGGISADVLRKRGAVIAMNTSGDIAGDVSMKRGLRTTIGSSGDITASLTVTPLGGFAQPEGGWTGSDQNRFFYQF